MRVGSFLELRCSRRDRVVLFSATVFLGVMAMLGSPARAQVLDAIRHETHQHDAFAPMPVEPSNNSSSNNESSSGSSNNTCDSSQSGSIVGDVVNGFLAGMASDEHSNVDGSFIAIITSPIWAPLAIANNDNLLRPFQRFPYADSPGYLNNITPDPRIWTFRLSLEYDANLANYQRASGEILFSTFNRIDLNAQGTEIWERKDGKWDSIFFERTNILWRFAQTEFFQFRTGVGMNFLADSKNEVGPTFHYGMQLFTARNSVLTGGIDWGTLGHAPVFHGRMTIGVQRRELEIFTGYDYQRIGDADISGVIAGCRLYF